MLSASKDGSVAVWNVTECRILHEIQMEGNATKAEFFPHDQ